MSAISRSNAPQSASLSSSAGAKTDLLISLHLHSWPALTLAIQNHWGGPTSDDKRDWFAGAVSDLLANGQVLDAEDLEEVLIQVMLDEFEVVVDDGSPSQVAASIIQGRQRILQGDYAELDQMLARWQEKQDKGQDKMIFKRAEQEDEGEETEWESSEEEEDDMELDEAPELVPRPQQEKPAAEVDEDGFTKVIGKKKR